MRKLATLRLAANSNAKWILNNPKASVPTAIALSNWMLKFAPTATHRLAAVGLMRTNHPGDRPAGQRVHRIYLRRNRRLPASIRLFARDGPLTVITLYCSPDNS